MSALKMSWKKNQSTKAIFQRLIQRKVIRFCWRNINEGAFIIIACLHGVHIWLANNTVNRTQWNKKLGQTFSKINCFCPPSWCTSSAAPPHSMAVFSGKFLFLFVYLFVCQTIHLKTEIVSTIKKHTLFHSRFIGKKPSELNTTTIYPDDEHR